MKILPPPGPERRRQLTRLGIVLLGLVLVAWYQWPQAAQVAPTSNSGAGAPAQTAAQALTLPEPVKLATLEDAPPAVEISRNPFSFGMRAAPPAAAGRNMPVVTPIVDGPAIPQGPPPIPLRLTGLMVAPGTNRTMVTLKDPATGSLFHAFEGDIVDGRYRVVRTGSQSVVVSYVDGSGIRTLGLGN